MPGFNPVWNLAPSFPFRRFAGRFVFMKKFFTRINGNDVMFFGGLGLLGVGIGLMSIPWALVVVGGILWFVGLLCQIIWIK